MYLSLIDVMYVSCLYFAYFICLSSPFLEENKISIYLTVSKAKSTGGLDILFLDYFLFQKLMKR